MKDAVANVMHQVAEQKAATKADAQAERERALRRGRRAWPLFILAAFGFAVALAYGVPRWRHPFKPPTGAAAERDARSGILFAESQVARYLAENGRPPASLQETGVQLTGIVYRVTPRGYELSTTVEGRTIVFASGEDRARFRAGHR